MRAESLAVARELDERTNELVYKKYYNIGIATATDAGLMVPVVQHADRLRLFDLANQIDRLSTSARDGTLAPEDLRNSTFTVTSLGKQGGLLATPILNHPEVAILGVHRIKEQPVVRDGQIVVGKVMYLSLSLDHRIVDGHIVLSRDLARANLAVSMGATRPCKPAIQCASGLS